MITKTAAFQTSDNKTHAILADAQKHEVLLLLSGSTGQATGLSVENCVDLIMTHKDKLVDILTTTASSKVRARKVNGGTKKRKPAPELADMNRELQDGKQ